MSKNDKEKKAYDEGPELLFDVADKQRKAKQAAEAKSEETKAQEAAETKQPEAPQPEEAPQQAAEADPKQIEEAVNAAVKDQEDKYMRLLAEYDNYRKRTQKEKEASWANAKAETIKELLPVYDNLARALQQKTEDEAYAKGVEMIMTQMKNALEKLGVEDMQPVITSKKTYIAPFVNAEKPQYLVIEDSFPNGRPALEKGFGVYMADRNTVNLSERMKVTVCLNPVHSATGPLGVVLGYDLFAHMLNTNEDMMKMARMVAYDEGLPVVADPGILSPQAFVDELFNDRFPNEYLGDTNLRLAVDVSQMVGIRFGETVKAYVAKYGDASKLTAIPLGIAGWFRYMLAVDDEGNKFELAPDPMNEEIGEQLGDIVVGKPETLKDQLKPILSNERLFFTDLYKDGVGEKIEEMFREMIAGPGAVKATIHKYVH